MLHCSLFGIWQNLGWASALAWAALTLDPDKMGILGYHRIFICFLVAFKCRAQVVFCFWLTCCQQSTCMWVSAIMGTVWGRQSGYISLWGWGAEDVGVPLPLQLRLWVLQEWFGEGKLSFFFFFFFPLLHEAKTTGPGEGQLQIPLLAKSNYKLYP